MSLGFIWNSYNSEVWGPALGVSFIGFGSAAFYLTNSIFTQLTSKLALKIGQIGVILSGDRVPHYLLYRYYCLPHHQERLRLWAVATREVSWCFLSNSTTDGAFHADTCMGGKNGSNCAVCAPFNSNGACDTGYSQCEWLNGDMVAPSGAMVFMIFLGAAVLRWETRSGEGQVPAVLQTLHDSKSGRQEPAMANLKMWQSLGVAIQFTINIYLGTHIATEAIVLLVCLGLSSLCLLVTHYRVANLDTGKLRSEVGMYDDLSRDEALSRNLPPCPTSGSHGAAHIRIHWNQILLIQYNRVILNTLLAIAVPGISLALRKP